MNYNTKYVVRLTEEEREQLESLVKTGKVAAAKRCRAQVLLKADAGPEGSGLTDEQVSEALSVSVGLVHSARQAYVEAGLTAAPGAEAGVPASLPQVGWGPGGAVGGLDLFSRTGGPCPVDDAAVGEQAGRVGNRRFDQQRRGAQRAQKNKLQPWLKHHWVLPKADDPDFICAMEDVLEVYTRPYDAECPQVCVDEVSKQLVKDITPPVPMQPGQPAREDYEYERCGTANLFMICEPLAGRRHVKVTDRRTSADFALVLRDLSDVHYPEAKKIVLVMDNLNTHKLSVLYQVFPPAEARRILERFEVHYTPQARQLAQHGRVRVISAQPPMPRSTDRLFRPSHGRSRRLGTPV